MSQRKNYFVAKGMQSKFILTLLLLLFLVAVITICNFYVIFEYVMRSMAPDSEESARTFIQLIREGAGYRVLLIGLVNIIIVAIIGVFYSHQFAGPSYKLDRSIRQIATGDLSFEIILRRTDAMTEIADSLNVLIVKYRGVFQKLHELIDRVKDTTAELEVETGGGGKEVAVIKGTMAEIEDLLAGIKLSKAPAATPADSTELSSGDETTSETEASPATESPK